MGNYFSFYNSESPDKNKNKLRNSYNTGITNNSIKYSTNIIHSRNENYYNSNNIKKYNQKENNKRYFYGYRSNSRKKPKTQINNRKLSKDKSPENKNENIFKKYALLFLEKNHIIPKSNENLNNSNTSINHNYMKKYKNDDKYYRYGKKTNTIMRDKKLNKKEKKKFNNTELIKDKGTLYKEFYDKKNNNNKNRKNKSLNNKNEKSSQFVLLNNSFNKNLFNTFQTVNNEKNNNYTTIGGNNNIMNELRLTTIDDIGDNFGNINTLPNNYENDLDIENLNNSESSSIKNNNNYTHTSFIYKRPQLLLEQFNGNDKDDNEMEKNDNIKVKKKFLTTINNIYVNNNSEESTYKYFGNISKDIKEGIGKIVYKNNIELLSLFENNKIKGPSLITDKYNNIFKGYVEDNNLNGYFIFNFNFYKNIRKNFNSINLDNEANDDISNIFKNYNSLIDFYLDISDNNYTYSYIESNISNNKICDVGIIKWKNNASYFGELKNGVRDGIGVFNWPDGSRYEGEFIKDRLEGWGVIYYLDGNIYRGEILNGLPHGYGEFIWSNESRYFGNYINGKKEGFGIYIMSSEDLAECISYFGFWKNGKQDGYGFIIKNKKRSYAKYKEGTKIKNYKPDIFIKEILPSINIIYRKLFSYDNRSLKVLINNIMYF